MFQPALAKLTIASVDDDTLGVSAQYNPKELQFDQPITWAPHESLQAQQPDEQVLEFGGVGGRTVKVELFFDGAELNGRIGRSMLVSRDGRTSVEEQDVAGTVAERIKRLRELAMVRNAHSEIEEMRRPHFCVLTWGKKADVVPPMRCVIESISVKYLMFGNDGTVLRASVTLGLREADRAALAKKQAKKAANRARARAGGR